MSALDTHTQLRAASPEAGTAGLRREVRGVLRPGHQVGAGGAANRTPPEPPSAHASHLGQPLCSPKAQFLSSSLLCKTAGMTPPTSSGCRRSRSARLHRTLEIDSSCLFSLKDRDSVLCTGRWWRMGISAHFWASI